MNDSPLDNMSKKDRIRALIIALVLLVFCFLLLYAIS